MVARDEDYEGIHTWNFMVPTGLEAKSLYREGTYIVKVSGDGARQCTDDAILSALIAKKMIPAEVAQYPNIAWYKEEDNFFSRVLVVTKGSERVHPDLASFHFNMSVTAPNQTSGKNVYVEVVSSSSQTNTFRIEYVPYTVSPSVVAKIAEDFCQVVDVKLHINRHDIYWVRTTTPLDKIPHWIVARNLIKNEHERKLLVTVKDRDIECFFCERNDHWSSRCTQRKEREKETRKRIGVEKKIEKETEAKRKKDEENRLEDERREKRQVENRKAWADLENDLQTLPWPPLHKALSQPQHVRDVNLPPVPEPQGEGRLRDALSQSPNKRQPPETETRDEGRHDELLSSAGQHDEDSSGNEEDPNECWKEDCRDTLSPRLLVQTRRDEVHRLLTKSRETRAEMEERDALAAERVQEIARSAKDALKRQKRDKKKQARKTNPHLQRKKTQAEEREENRLIVAAIKEAQQQKEKQMDDRPKETVDGASSDKTCNDAGDADAKPEEEPDEVDDSLFLDASAAQAGSRITPPRDAELPREPTSTSTPMNLKDAELNGSLRDFYSSNPESEFSKIESFLQVTSQALTPRGRVRPPNRSMSDNDSKKFKQSLEWMDEDFRLASEPVSAPEPYTLDNTYTKAVAPVTDQPEIDRHTPSESLSQNYIPPSGWVAPTSASKQQQQP